MTKRQFAKRAGFGLALRWSWTASAAPSAGAQQAEPAPKAGKLIKAGDVLSGN